MVKEALAKFKYLSQKCLIQRNDFYVVKEASDKFKLLGKKYLMAAQ